MLHSVVHLMFRSTVEDADLHDALEDAKQIQIITEGIERLAGPKFSLPALAAPTCSESFWASSFDVAARTRHQKIKERLLKMSSTRQVPRPAASPSVSYQASNSSWQSASAASSNGNSRAGRCVCCCVVCKQLLIDCVLCLCLCLYSS
jgi:hypothetical protein